MPQLVATSEPAADAPLPVLKLYCKGSEIGPLTAAKMRIVLGWENEEEYKERRTEENPDQPPESFVFITDADIVRGHVGKAKHPIPPGRTADPVLLTDHKKRSVVCWKNDNNRPFDENHCKKLCQEILTRRWAGPTTMAGETVNGEAIITSWPILLPSRPQFTDPQPIVINGQHTGCALILAHELWSDEDEEISKKWRELWPPDQYPDGPVIDKVVVTGVSPHARVVQTLDNVKPRSLSDTIYTSDLFRELSDSDKKLASRMLSTGVDFLWARLRVGLKQEGFLKKLYQTHATSHDWLARHPRLLKCVEHLFVENKGRAITKVKLSAGECAAIMYLQASSTSDSEDYHAQEEPNEKTLKWDLWEKAAKFWSLVADDRTEITRTGTFPKNKEAAAIRTALINAIEDDTEDDEGNTVQVEQKGGTKRRAKMVVLSKAWALFKNGEPITLELITPTYRAADSRSTGFNEEGESTGSAISLVTLDDESHFGGIDLGDLSLIHI